MRSHPACVRLSWTADLGKCLDTDAAVLAVPTGLEGDRLSAAHVQEVITKLHEAGYQKPILVASTLDPRSATSVCGDPGTFYTPVLIRLGAVRHDLERAPFFLIGTLYHEMASAAVLDVLHIWAPPGLDWPVGVR